MIIVDNKERVSLAFVISLYQINPNVDIYTRSLGGGGVLGVELHY